MAKRFFRDDIGMLTWAPALIALEAMFHIPLLGIGVLAFIVAGIWFWDPLTTLGILVGLLLLPFLVVMGLSCVAVILLALLAVAAFAFPLGFFMLIALFLWAAWRWMGIFGLSMASTAALLLIGYIGWHFRKEGWEHIVPSVRAYGSHYGQRKKTKTLIHTAGDI